MYINPEFEKEHRTSYRFNSDPTIEKKIFRAASYFKKRIPSSKVGPTLAEELERSAAPSPYQDSRLQTFPVSTLIISEVQEIARKLGWRVLPYRDYVHKGKVELDDYLNRISERNLTSLRMKAILTGKNPTIAIKFPKLIYLHRKREHAYLTAQDLIEPNLPWQEFGLVSTNAPHLLIDSKTHLIYNPESSIKELVDYLS